MAGKQGTATCRDGKTIHLSCFLWKSPTLQQVDGAGDTRVTDDLLSSSPLQTVTKNLRHGGAGGGDYYMAHEGGSEYGAGKS